MDDPLTSGTPVDGSFLLVDAVSQPGSASGSFQNDASFLSDPDADSGFQRPDFGAESLTGTVQPYDRHVFLCYKSPRVWPAHVEATEFDRLPRLLSAAVKSKEGLVKRRTRLTICKGEDGTESSNGDILIFPDMVRYRRLTHFDVDNFVEEALVKDAEWLPGAAERLKGSYVFVCSHGSRDRRCGVCGPPLINRFKEEISLRDLPGQVSVSACSHIGGHKYAGNVIIFSPNVDGKVAGHWYGYVSPDDVPALLDLHIGKGEILAHLWRGQMGLSEEEQKKVLDDELQLDREIKNQESTKEVVQTDIGRCQGIANSTCCQNPAPVEEHQPSPPAANEKGSKGTSARKECALPTWFECWEREDTYAALSVVAAAVSVGVAYACYKHMK